MVIELSGVQFGLKSYAWFQNWTSGQCKFNLKSQVWFQTKIARHEVQLPLYYIYFEITQQEKVKINSFVYKGAGLLENVEFLQQSLQNFPSKMFPVFFFNAIWLAKAVESWNLIGCFIFNACLWNGWKKDAI